MTNLIETIVYSCLLLPIIVAFFFDEIVTKITSASVATALIVVVIYICIFVAFLYFHWKRNRFPLYLELYIIFFIDGVHSYHLFHKERVVSWYLAFLCLLVTIVSLAHHYHEHEKKIKKEIIKKEFKWPLIFCFMLFAFGTAVSFCADYIDTTYTKVGLENACVEKCIDEVKLNSAN